MHDFTKGRPQISVVGDTIEIYKGKDGSLYIMPVGNVLVDSTNAELKEEPKSLNDLRDEYHSIGELYEFRKAYNALLFNEWAKTSVGYTDEYKALSIEERMVGVLEATSHSKKKYDVHKSWRHNDGELCFGGGWFIVVAILPTGQITNHYKAEDWDLFQIPELEKAKYEFDGHTSADTLDRMLKLLKQ